LPVSSGRFPQAIRVLRYSRTTTEEIVYFHIRGYYPLGHGFPATSVNKLFDHSPRYKTDIVALQPPTLIAQNPALRDTVRLRSSLGSIRFRSPLLTKCFLPPARTLTYADITQTYAENANTIAFRLRSSASSLRLSAILSETRYWFLFLQVLKCFTSLGLLARSAQVTSL